MTSYNLEKFEPSEHFKERALERFGVSGNDLKTFIREHRNLSEPFHSDGSSASFLSKSAVFVVNIKEKVIITVYSAVNDDLGNSVKDRFLSQMEDLATTSRLEVAKDYFGYIENDLDMFYTQIKRLIHQPTSALSLDVIDDAYNRMAIIKTTMRILEQQLAFYNDFTKTSYNVEPSVVQTSNEHVNNSYDKDEIPLKQLLTSDDRIEINIQTSKFGNPALSSKVAKLIKAGASKTKLLSTLKPEMSIVSHNKLAGCLTDLIKARVENEK